MEDTRARRAELAARVEQLSQQVFSLSVDLLQKSSKATAVAADRPDSAEASRLHASAFASAELLGVALGTALSREFNDGWNRGVQAANTVRDEQQARVLMALNLAMAMLGGVQVQALSHDDYYAVSFASRELRVPAHDVAVYGLEAATLLALAAESDDAPRAPYVEPT